MFSREQEGPCLFSEEVDGRDRMRGWGGGGYLGQREQRDQKQEKI